MPATPQTKNQDQTFITDLLRFFPYVVVFLLATTHPIDLDLGWHLKYGEYIFNNHAILRENTFTSAMPGYHYLNHSWASELILYTFFRAGGFMAISLLGATMITATFFFLARAANLDKWGESLLFPAMLFLLDGVVEQSFRSQYFSFLGIAILIYLLSRPEQYARRVAFAIPFLFLLWANLHGQFIMGLGLYAIWLMFFYLGEIHRHKRQETATYQFINLLPATTFFFSFIATLANPYGFTLYQEIFRHFGNPLQKFVTEWQPITTDPELLMMFLTWSSFMFLSILVGRMWEAPLKHGYILLPLLSFFIATFAQRRYFWPFVLLSIPAMSPLLLRLKPSRKSLACSISLIVLATSYLFATIAKLPSQHLFRFDWAAYCRYNSFSPNSAELLKKIAPGHRLFNDYDLGGWLIWNYPSIKPAIDGRMPFWRDNKGYSAYQEYLALEQGIADIDASSYDLVYWPPHKTALYTQLIALTDSGKWRHIYDDPFASIFVRSDNIGQLGSHEVGRK